MDKLEFKEFFLNECKKNDINMENIEIEKFYTYMNGILSWNDKINVTAIKDEKEFIVKHFVDSLTAKDYIATEDRVLDIGTGAGFPGIPLKLVHSNNKFVLVDSVNKKLNVIRDLIPKLELKNIECIHGRAEDLANNKEYRETFDIVTSRAVSNLSTLVEYMLPFVKVGGKIICLKGPNYEEELRNATKAIKVLGGKLEAIENKIISDDYERNLIVIRKINPTPKQYPRGQGKPLKEPIK